MIQLTLTLKSTAQVVETSVTINNNSPIQDYVHPDDQTQPTFEMTPGFKPFTWVVLVTKLRFAPIVVRNGRSANNDAMTKRAEVEERRLQNCC